MISRLRDRNKEMIEAIVLNSIMLFLFFVLFNPQFEANDDISMSWIVEGAYGARYDKLVFSNFMYGWILKGLYTICPVIKWYSVILCMAIFTSFCVLTYICLKKIPKPMFYYVFIIAGAYFGYEGYTLLGFTKTAGIVSIAGYTLLFWALEKRFENRKALLFGGILLIWGSWIRFFAFLMVTAIFGMYGLAFSIKKIKTERTMKAVVKVLQPYVLCFGVCLVLIFSCEIFDGLSYQSDAEWEKYEEYNSLRAQVIDHGYLSWDKYSDKYEVMGISEIDVKMWASWNFADFDNFNIDVMKQIMKFDEGEKSFISYIKPFLLTCMQLFSVKVFICFLCFLLLYIIAEKKKEWVTLVFLALAVGGIIFYLVYNERYGLPRINLTLWMAPSAVLLLLINRKDEGIICNTRAGIIIPLLVISFMGQDLYSAAFERNNGNFSVEMSELFEQIGENQNDLYLMMTNSEKVTSQFGMWDVAPYGYRKNVYALGGWSTNAPYTNIILENYNVENPFADMKKSNIHVVSRGDIDILIEYLRENYDPNTYAVLEKEIGELGIYRIH